MLLSHSFPGAASPQPRSRGLWSQISQVEDEAAISFPTEKLKIALNMAGSPGKRQHNSNRMFLGSPWPRRWPWCSWWSPFGLHLDSRQPFSQASTLPAPPSQADAGSLQQQHLENAQAGKSVGKTPENLGCLPGVSFCPLSISLDRSSANAEAKRQIDLGSVSSSFPLQSHQTGPREHPGAPTQ